MPEPDVVVVERSALGEFAVERTPLLVVEVLSCHQGTELVRKLELYATGGCPNYWIVDPDVPSVLVLGLLENRYAEAVTITGAESVELVSPFPVALSPALLVAD